jgi:predicted O-linked N-acetylglucosamine transferase (SPINDLY family)
MDDYAEIIDLAWTGKLEFSRLLEQASLLEQNNRRGLAVVLYHTWLDRNKTTFNHFAYFNLGTLLYGENDVVGAIDAYLQASQLAPGFVQPRLNLGLAYERLGQFDAAIAEWQWVTQHARQDTPGDLSLKISAHNHLGRLQESLKRLGDALANLEKSLELDPQQPDAIHHWVFLREKMCCWPIYTPLGGLTLEQMKASTSALAMLSLSDDPEAQLAAATSYSQRKIPENLPVLAPTGGYRHDKIRVAYCSSDFCLHPVAMLTVELFELHDRNNFEVFAFCWSPEDGSALRSRIIAAADHFIRIDTLDDLSAAQLIRNHEIDILVDLHGQTRGARTTMLACRPAPIQITYLGLPATTGLPCIDYVLADHFLIPEAFAHYYSEKPLYMPEVYQVSDRQRLCAPPPSRNSCGLPATGFVFCSFNNNNKYTPEIFEAWMRILGRVPDSILWLLSDNQWAEENLKKRAVELGIDEHRLIFADRTSPQNYLARYQLADLFLDTFPFNAGTTANDALWMSLPILTLSGRCFASRMAGALLTAAGLPELITASIQDYEDKAVALATEPDACRQLKERLSDARDKGVLFDTPRFVQNYEALLGGLIAQQRRIEATPT